MKLSRTLFTLAKQAGGSYKTVHDRRNILSRVCAYLKTTNVRIQEPKQFKTKHIQSYIQHRIQQGIGKRTLQNEMAVIRQILRQSGRAKLADSPLLTNKALGIDKTSRDGTKEAIPNVLYQQVLSAARDKDEGLAATLQLARVLGLRSEEAVQSAQSLETWLKDLRQGKKKLTVIFGTKGGRDRETLILDREAVKQAIEFALQVASQRKGRLIDKPNLKQAMNYWGHQTRALGLTGKYSPHSLRYAWAQDAMRYYMQQEGKSRKEALALTAISLGHGDGRGRYVKQVYALQDEKA